jgi:hypothetical protein
MTLFNKICILSEITGKLNNYKGTGEGGNPSISPVATAAITKRTNYNTAIPLHAEYNDPYAQ